jgi:hypothetical protein
MATCELSGDPRVAAVQPVSGAAEALHQIKEMAQGDPSFQAALRGTASTQEAAHLLRRRGITVSPEALWRHRGTLIPGGLPTWRG